MSGEILITCGPIPARLDSVKFITNRFKGGLSLLTAEKLHGLGHNVTLCAWEHSSLKTSLPIITVKDVQDYYSKVLDKKYDAYILSAAVANLMPVSPWKGKFPSHIYKENEEFNIKFKIAPRVIDAIKKHNPRSCLIGYKLFDGTHEELLCAGKKTLLESKANLIFANTPEEAKYKKWALTQDGCSFEMDFSEHILLINKLLVEKWYQTKIADFNLLSPTNTPDITYLSNIYPKHTDPITGQIFGSFAFKTSYGFVTTSRGKSLGTDDLCDVYEVNHDSLTITASKKATLNAPLFDLIFKQNPNINIIVHGHDTIGEIFHNQYEFPGTTGDLKNCPKNKDFFNINLKHHGFIAGFSKLIDYLNFKESHGL